MTGRQATTEPRTIAPDSFSVAPELVGLPLARPWRRLWAMLIDLLLIAILAGAGPFVFLAFASAVLVWRAIAARRPQGAAKRAGVGAAQIAFAMLAFILVIRVGDMFDRSDADDRPDFEPPPNQFFSPEDVANIVERTAGAEAAAEVRAAMGTISDSTDDAQPELTPAQKDSVVLDYAAAVEREDSIAVHGLRAAASSAIAGDRIRALEEHRDRTRQENRELDEEVASLRDQLEEAREPPSLRSVLLGLGDDLGIGFGWGALYFTAFLSIGRGQTPGKRLAGVRVLRLDGKPLSWWQSFERFGGYFASVTTGLLGFAQILWDRNRQALHDKIVETVVVRDNRRWGHTVKTPT